MGCGNSKGTETTEGQGNKPTEERGHDDKPHQASVNSTKNQSPRVVIVETNHEEDKSKTTTVNATSSPNEKTEETPVTKIEIIQVPDDSPSENNNETNSERNKQSKESIEKDGGVSSKVDVVIISNVDNSHDSKDRDSVEAKDGGETSEQKGRFNTEPAETQQTEQETEQSAE